jgi:hypothetical protein
LLVVPSGHAHETESPDVQSVELAAHTHAPKVSSLLHDWTPTRPFEQAQVAEASGIHKVALLHTQAP